MADAAKYWGLTPRVKQKPFGLSSLFAKAQKRKARLPTPWIQNAEHLAEHSHPQFEIAKRAERETVRVGQAVDVLVFGPRSKTKQDRVKVRIRDRRGRRPLIHYTAVVETPIRRTHLAKGSKELEFGPENIATIYVVSPAKKR